MVVSSVGKMDPKMVKYSDFETEQRMGTEKVPNLVLTKERNSDLLTGQRMGTEKVPNLVLTKERNSDLL